MGYGKVDVQEVQSRALSRDGTHRRKIRIGSGVRVEFTSLVFHLIYGNISFCIWIVDYKGFLLSEFILLHRPLS